MGSAAAERRLGPGALTLFAAGDFACNLYWQSVTLFLLFFYTDVLLLPPATAGLVAMAGALWDGAADLIVGIVAQRALSYRRFVALGALPLGIAFAALFALPGGQAAAGLALATQVAFRTLYALVNVPYAAWSTRISDDSRDRATIAGLRMLFGTAAATLVALTMPTTAMRLGTSVATGYAVAAIGYAAIGIPLLWLVGRRSREVRPTPPAMRVGVLAYMAVLARNRAFVTLNLAAAAAGVAAAVVAQSVLHYFDHVVRDSAAGSHALALMGVAGAVCVPIWMAVARRVGPRATWFAASALGLACLAAHRVEGDGTAATQALLVGLQAAFAGLNLAFWAMLPDTVEYGEAHSGVRVEAIAFGVAALLQKVALAAAAGAIGIAYARIGYAAGAVQAPATVAGIRATMLAVPAVAIAASAAAMLANPLRRDVHTAIVERLRRSA